MVGVTVEDDATICAGAVLRPGVTVGTRSVVGMGAVVTQDVLPDTVVYGNPAQARYDKEDYLRKKRDWESSGVQRHLR
jgi:maltose O-acetyltransferase